jgi:AraC-like DNA-binding protein
MQGQPTNRNDAASAFFARSSGALAGGRRGPDIRPMDPLSDVLRAVRLSGAYFYLVEARHPWTASAVAAAALAPQVLPDAEHLISYHILISGSCWAGFTGGEPVSLQAGDAIVFPHGDAHVLSSLPLHDIQPVRESSLPERYSTLRLGDGAGAPTVVVCGFLGWDLRPYNPLIEALPRLMHVPGIAGAGGWLAEFPRQVVAESRLGRAGGESMLTRMAELMFLEVVRRYLEALPPERSGWLAGLRDPVVARALAELHGRPSHPWNLPELARAVAASRTVLVERFSELVGIPPMQYLTQWRLQLAAEQLLSGSAKVAAIGAGVGYESEAAFSRAFKRATGKAPAEWRRARLRV